MVCSFLRSARVPVPRQKTSLLISLGQKLFLFIYTDKTQDANCKPRKSINPHSPHTPLPVEGEHNFSINFSTTIPATPLKLALPVLSKKNYLLLRILFSGPLPCAMDGDTCGRVLVAAEILDSLLVSACHHISAPWKNHGGMFTAGEWGWAGGHPETSIHYHFPDSERDLNDPN